MEPMMKLPTRRYHEMEQRIAELEAEVNRYGHVLRDGWEVMALVGDKLLPDKTRELTLWVRKEGSP